MGVELSEKVRKKVPKSSLAEFDDIRMQAMEAFAEHPQVRMEYMLGFVLSFWLLSEYDKRRIHLSKWARGYLYHFSTSCGKRLRPEEIEEAEQFLSAVAQGQ